MNIAIDCRYIGKSGIGRVLEGILDNLDYVNHSYYLIGNPELLRKYNAIIIEDLTEPYSRKGLTKFSKAINKTCDAIIIPNFLVPFGIKIPIYSIIHDLIFLDLPKITTKNFVDYNIKKYLLKRCVKKSSKIFCDSKFTLNRCLFYYKKYSNKFILNYVGLSKSVLNYKIDKKIIKENKILFVGNVKPHKGIETLIDAFEPISYGDLTLKIVGAKDSFLTNAKLKEINNVEFTGKISDEELLKEISTSKYLVLPSKYEGFGLPPLEAVCLNTQPIVSNIEVFHEVYEGLPVKFFSSIGELSDLMKKNPDKNINEYRETILKKYNYKNTVDIILNEIGD